MSVLLTRLFAVQCFYDGMLSYVEVNHHALLADLSTDGQERAKFNMYSGVGAVIGSMSSIFTQLTWQV